MTEVAKIIKFDQVKQNFRVRLIELAVITMTLLVALSSINEEISVTISIFLMLIATTVVVISFKFDKFQSEKVVNQDQTGDTKNIKIEENNLNKWDWIYLSLYLTSILTVGFQLLFSDFRKFLNL